MILYLLESQGDAANTTSSETKQRQSLKFLWTKFLNMQILGNVHGVYWKQCNSTDYHLSHVLSSHIFSSSMGWIRPEHGKILHLQLYEIY